MQQPKPDDSLSPNLMKQLIRRLNSGLRAKAQAIIDSHSTKLANNASQVAGYLPQSGRGANELLAASFEERSTIMAGLRVDPRWVSSLRTPLVHWTIFLRESLHNQGWSRRYAC